jgi:hypothetical protein
MKLTPGSVDTLDARKGVLVEKHLAGDDEGTGGRHIDARPRRVLRWSEADPKPATVGKVPVAVPASKRHKDPNKAAESPKVGDGGRGARQDVIGRQVATGGLRKAIQDPVGSLKSPRVPRRPKVGISK